MGSGFGYNMDKTLPRGDRDDFDEEDEVVVEAPVEEEKPKRLVREIVKKKLKVDNMSQAFNPDYYLYNIEKCKKGSENYIFWQTMFNYATRVKDLYIVMVKQQNIALKREQILPDYMLDSPGFTAKEAAKILFDVEQSMLQTFKEKKINFQKKFENYPTFKELRQFAIQAWLMYENLAEDNFIRNIVKTQENYETMDLTNEANFAYVYSWHRKIEYYIKTKIATVKNGDVNLWKVLDGNFPADKVLQDPYSKARNTSYSTPTLYQHMVVNDLYSDIDITEQYNNILKMFNGYDYEAHEQEMYDRKMNLQTEDAIRITNCYDHYGMMKQMYILFDRRLGKLKLENLESNLGLPKEKIDSLVGIDQVKFFTLYRLETKTEDICKGMYKYFYFLQKRKADVSGKPEYEFVEEDFTFLMKKFAYRLSAIQDVYKQYSEALEETIKDLKAKNIKPYREFEPDNFYLDFKKIDNYLGARVYYKTSKLCKGAKNPNSTNND